MHRVFLSLVSLLLSMPSDRRLLNRRTNFVDSISSGITRVFNSIFANLFNSVEKEADLLMGKLEAKAILIQKRVTKDVASFFLIGMGVLFLIASVYFYMIEYLLIARANAFFILAVMLFILSWAIKEYGGGDHGAKTYQK